MVLTKNVKNTVFLLFISYDLMSCDVFTWLVVNKLQFLILLEHIISKLSITFLF